MPQFASVIKALQDCVATEVTGLRSIRSPESLHQEQVKRITDASVSRLCEPHDADPRSHFKETLVHMLARDCLSDSMQRQYWTAASSIVAAARTDGYQVSDYQFRRSLVPHIDSCVSLCKDRPFITASSGPGRIYMGKWFARVFEENGRFLSAFELREKIFEASQRTLGDEHPDTLDAMNNLANSYRDLGRRQEAMELEEKAFEASQRTLGDEHPDTRDALTNLSILQGRSDETPLDLPTLEVC
ncbi:hypothetical protein MANI_021620 [Metarhizium anisopliae]|nr:hypothetical protein MANI_021620 [Metarhizium anisopliae]